MSNFDIDIKNKKTVNLSFTRKAEDKSTPHLKVINITVVYVCN